MFEQVRSGGIQVRVFTAMWGARGRHTVNRQKKQEEPEVRSVGKGFALDRARFQAPTGDKVSVETTHAYDPRARKVEQEDEKFKVTLETHTAWTK